MTYQYIKVSEPRSGVLLVQLNRPKALNALRTGLIVELIEAISKADRDVETYGAVVITGNEFAFAAGADIKEMEHIKADEALRQNFLGNWSDLGRFGIPIIAAVERFALGGGCELAMSTDIIYASKTAKFGQPEIKLGVIPGGGGTQRLIRAIGKSRAMEYNLTGDMFSALQAEQWGLVSKTFEPGTVLENALKLGERIARGPRTASRACKKAVNAANETPLSHGLDFERTLFHALFGSKEQQEGMSAFVEKRKANFNSKL
jgi:enoyl-CoA hydratase